MCIEKKRFFIQECYHRNLLACVLNPIVVQLVWDADCIQCKLSVCRASVLCISPTYNVEFHRVTMSFITVKALECMNSSGL